MKKNAAILMLIFASFFANAQKESNKPQKSRYDPYPSVDLIYGQKFLQTDFYGQLKTLHKFRKNAPLSFIGINLQNTKDEDSDIFKGNLSYYYMLPQRIQLQDTISSMISGYALSIMGNLPDCWPTARNADLFFSLGGSFGRTKLSDNPHVNQKNAFIAPKISFMPRFLIGSLTLALRVEYEYDISRYKWTNLRKGANTAEIASLNQSGFSIMFMMGYAFSKYK